MSEKKKLDDELNEKRAEFQDLNSQAPSHARIRQSDVSQFVRQSERDDSTSYLASMSACRLLTQNVRRKATVRVSYLMMDKLYSLAFDSLYL
jgi:hypothetical protein